MTNMNLFEELNKVGYRSDIATCEKIQAMLRASQETKDYVEAMLLTGIPAAGKTSLAEKISEVLGCQKIVVQCNSDMNQDNLIGKPNMSGILKNDANNVISDGAVVRAIKASMLGPVCLIVDELDKASSSLDALLLDALQNCRVADGNSELVGNPTNLIVFITSNGNRDIEEALISRCRRVTLHRMPKADFLSVLGVSENHHIGDIYDKYPNFSIREARKYLADIDGSDKLNANLLSQYVDCEENEIVTDKGILFSSYLSENLADDLFGDYGTSSLSIEASPMEDESLAALMMESRYADFDVDGEYVRVGTLTAAKEVMALGYKLQMSGNMAKIILEDSDVQKIMAMKHGAIARVNGKTIMGEISHGSFVTELSSEALKTVLGLEIEVAEDYEEEEEY